MSYGISKMPTCDAPGCEGHLGKFEDCVSKAVWSASLDFSDETTGDTSSFGGHYALVITDGLPASVENNTIAVPAGNYIVESLDSGAVYVQSYDTADEADATFEEIQTKYGEFCDANEELYP